MQEVAEPRLNGNTNAAVAQLIRDLQYALRLANADKAALRRWLADLPPPAS
jgi:hypothetical protein